MENDVSPEVDIHTQMVYLNSVRFNLRGSPYRNVVFQTDQDEVIYSIYSQMFDCTSNQNKDFFGMYTTSNTMVMPPLTAHELQPFKLRTVNVQNPVHQKVEEKMGRAHLVLLNNCHLYHRNHHHLSLSLKVR